jgi:hypothetical protein
MLVEPPSDVVSPVSGVEQNLNSLVIPLQRPQGDSLDSQQSNSTSYVGSHIYAPSSPSSRGRADSTNAPTEIFDDVNTLKSKFHAKTTYPGGLDLELSL